MASAPPSDQLHEAVDIRSGCFYGAGVAPVAQHRDPVGDGQRRVEVMRDEEDARARGRDVRDEREQIVALVPGQVGRRLVEHEQAAAAVAGVCRQPLHGPGDGDLRALHRS